MVLNNGEVDRLLLRCVWVRNRSWPLLSGVGGIMVENETSLVWGVLETFGLRVLWPLASVCVDGVFR